MWVARITNGIDIREYGSKSAGLTNTIRVLGWKKALPVLVVDLVKGFLAVFIAQKLVAAYNPDFYWLPLVAGILAILGHSFTCLAGFRGGKGVLSALGVFLALCPLTALASFAIWIVVTIASRYVSVGSIVGCVALMVISLLANLGLIFPSDHMHLALMLTCWLIALFVIYKHKANIKRLLNGTENGFGKKRKTPRPAELAKASEQAEPAEDKGNP